MAVLRGDGELCVNGNVNHHIRGQAGNVHSDDAVEGVVKAAEGQCVGGYLDFL